MLSIIICTYNREKYLGETLERLAANHFDGAWELVLVNNNSTDSTAQICAAFEATHPEVSFRYFVETQQGLSSARNRGMQEAKGDWLVFLDDDAFVEADYLERLNNYTTALPEMDAFGGRIYPLFEDGNTPQWLCRWTRIWLSALDMGDNVRLFSSTQYPIGANMGFSRRMAEQCGTFDVTLGRSGKNMVGGEEKDYFRRLRQHKAKIFYLPDIAVQHCIPSSRTTRDYICRLAEGVGQSLRLRTQASYRYPLAIVVELVKWFVFAALWCYYMLLGRRECGNALMLFRRHVMKGLLG